MEEDEEGRRTEEDVGGRRRVEAGGGGMRIEDFDRSAIVSATLLDFEYW